MKLNEVNDPVMKLRLELSKMQTNMDQQDEQIMNLLVDNGQLQRDVAALQKTVSALIRKLGPKS